MKNWLAFGLVISEVAGLWAQQSPGRRAGGPPPPPSGRSEAAAGTRATTTVRDPNVKPASLEGVVLSASGEPLRKAEVRVMRMDARQQMGSPDGSTVVTDDAGRFSFPSLDPGRYNVFAQRTGYVGSSFGARRGGRGGTPITLAAGQEMKKLEIKLFKQGVISGRVLDEDGEPLQHSMVQLMQQRYMRGRKQLMPIQGGQVNDLGEYRVASLAPGKYYVSVSPQRMMMRGPEAAPATDKPYDETYGAMYYPNATDPAQATVIEVTQGNEVTGIDFRMRKARSFRIRGKVLDTDGQPARNVFISVAPAGDSFMFGPRGGTTARGNGGTFELTGIAPGSYNLVVNRADRGNRLQMIVPVVVGEQHLNDVNIQLAEPLTVKGVVRVEGKDKADVGNTRLMLEPAQGMMWGNNGGSVKDGAFEVAGISPGKYRITAVGLPDGHYIKSVRVANQDVPDRMVDFTSGAGPIDIVLSDKAGQISGSVQDAEGKAASGITVVAIPADVTKREAVDAYRQTQSDQTGAFSIKSLPPGDWVVYAFADAEDGAYQDPEWMRKYEGSGAKLSIKESGSETATLKVLQ